MDGAGLHAAVQVGDVQMSPLELVGFGALYVIGVVAFLYLAMFLIGTFVKGGLEVLALMSWTAVLIIIAGAAGGFVLIGAALF